MNHFALGARGHDFPQTTPQELFAALAYNEFFHLQLAPGKSFGYTQASEVETDKIQQALVKNHLQISVYGCYVEIAMADKAIREAAVAQFLQSMKIAKRLGSTCIACETTDLNLQPQVGREEAFRILCSSLETILTYAQKLELTVCIEPVWNHTIHTPQMAERLLKTLCSQQLGIIFDPVNLLTVPMLPKQQVLWQQSMECFGEVIKAVHIKGAREDNRGVLVPCGLKDSCVDYQKLFGLLGRLGRTLPVIREELQMTDIQEDKAFLKTLWCCAK